MSPGRARLPWTMANGPSDSVRTLEGSIPEISLLPFLDASIVRLTEKNGRRLISGMDPSRVLTESDGPFAMVQGRRARPGDMPLTIQRLAEFWGEESEAVRAVVMENWASAANMKSAEG